MDSIPLHFHASSDALARLDALANQISCDRDSLLNEALLHYLDLQEWQMKEIRKAVAEADAGRVVPHDQIRKMLDTLGP